MYKIYTYLNIDKKALLDNLYNFIVDLGPFFVKIFQNLSSKKLLPLDLVELSEKSKDSVYYNTNDYNCILKEIKDTGFEIENEAPIGAGSICLVYKGKYKGNNSVIKICHSDIKQKMERSMKIVNFLIKIFTFFGYQVLISNIDFEDILGSLNKQIDLSQEVVYIQLYRKQLEKHKLLNIIDVPVVYEHCNNYIIESYIDGLSYHEIVEKHTNKTFECITLLRILIRKQFLEFDIQHGDLHSSNYLYKIENNKVKLYLMDFGLCHDMTTTARRSAQECARRFDIPETSMTHPLGIIFMYCLNQGEAIIKKTIKYLNNNKDRYPILFNFLRKLFPNIHDDFLFEHFINNREQMSRKQLFTFQFENNEHLTNFMSQTMSMLELSSIYEWKEKLDGAKLSSNNGCLKAHQLITNLEGNKKYCDMEFCSNDLFQNFLEYFVKFSIENLPQEKYLDDIDDKIKMSYQQIIYLFQMKYKDQLNRKDIKQILDQYQTEIKDYLYHFFYRNQYYSQRNIIIEKMYSMFYLKSDLLHGMIEYLQLKKPNGLRQEYYEIPVSDINIEHIAIKNNKITYTNCEKGIFKGDEITKIDNLDVTNYTLEECLNIIVSSKNVVFKDCFSLI